MNIFLLRHGETRWALSGRHTGLTNIPLTDNGVRQSVDAGVRLRSMHPDPFHDAYVSPLERALRTFEYADVEVDALHVEYQVHEWDYGYAEGLSTRSINDMLHGRGSTAPWTIWDDDAQSILREHGLSYHDDVDADNDIAVSPPHDGEAALEVYERASAFLNTLDTSHDILIVAHSHIIRFLAAAWVHEPAVARHLAIEPDRIEVLSDRNGSRDITGWGL